METKTNTNNPWRLFWLSFLILFLEIGALRWMGVEFPTVRVFPNLIIMVALIATSAGLTISQAKITKIGLLKTKPMLWASSGFLLVSLIAAPKLHIYQQSFRFDHPWQELVMNMSFFIVVMIALYSIFFKLGSLLEPLFEELPALKAYSLNLLGSILGVIVFAMISFFAAPPFVWLLILALVLFFITKEKAILVLGFITAFAAFALNNGSLWSAYSKLDVMPVNSVMDRVYVKGSYALFSNNEYYHFAIHPLVGKQLNEYATENLHSKIKGVDFITHYLHCLEVPFHCRRSPTKVLILGSGSGNDVSCALAENAEHIDAVEIDPIICSLGKTRHPDYPYLDPRVTTYNEDARTFLRRGDNKYDLIEFAYLDPGPTVRAASFLRVDNYVYTVEAVQSVLRRLQPDGVGAILFAFADGPKSVVVGRIYNIITQASGSPPLAFCNNGFGCMVYLFGPGCKKVNIQELTKSFPDLQIWTPTAEQLAVRPATDQWPFLYTDFNYAGIWLYLGTLAAVIVLPSVVIFHGQSKEAKFAEMGNMFFLGLAFMLIETKAIVELSLLFGATWIVSSVVISAILILALLANLYVQKMKRIPLPYIYGALACCLALQYFLSVPDRSNWSPVIVAGIASLIACLPIFFSGMIFSYCFREAEHPSSYLAANLLGVAFGGLTENLSLIFGIKGLVWIALCVYCLSALCMASSRLGPYLRQKQPEAN